MNNQPLTPTSTSTSQMVVIPEFTPGFGPRFGRLPDELLLQIFKIVAIDMFPETHRLKKMINAKTFQIMRLHNRMKHILTVSPNFTGFFLQAFYENFAFNFKANTSIRPAGYFTTIPAALPRPHLRHHVRSMRIEITLENYYILSGQRCEIVTANQLLAFCPSAVLLSKLTGAESGFANLASLDLHIRTNFCHFSIGDAYLRVLEEVGFVVTARRVRLAVTGTDGSVSPVHDEVKQRIVVVE